MGISVVIPVRNEEKRLARCLEGLKNQEEKPDEIIIADADSTDQTVNIAKSFGATVVEHCPSGIAKTRNAGFNQAKYDIIARCDADSIVPPNWIKRIKYDFANEKIDALVGPIIYFDLPFKTTLYSKIFIYLMRRRLHHNVIMGPNMAISKNMWFKIRNEVCLEDKDVHEDIDLSFHINKLGGVIKYDPLFIAKTSGRRILDNPRSFFIEYPSRLNRMLRAHNY